LFITNALQGKKLPLYGDGLNVRDWLYVKDNCVALDLVLRQGQIGEVYNIGGGSEKTNIEITRFILEELDLGEEMIQHVEDRLGHDRRYSIDSGKVKQLGWQPKTKLADGLSATIKWYQKNQAWWHKLKEK